MTPRLSRRGLGVLGTVAASVAAWGGIIAGAILMFDSIRDWWLLWPAALLLLGGGMVCAEAIESLRDRVGRPDLRYLARLAAVAVAFAIGAAICIARTV